MNLLASPDRYVGGGAPLLLSARTFLQGDNGSTEPGPPKRNTQAPPDRFTGEASQYFTVPKEGGDSQRSGDKFASRMDGNVHCYAIADGVSTSFLPAKWAEIVVDSLVERTQPFVDQQDFDRWFSACRNRWDEWVRDTWLPQYGQRTNKRDWSSEIARGAETTFVWCFLPVQPLRNNGKTRLEVTAIGDSNLFLISQDSNPKTFPKKGLASFDAQPATLATALELTDLPWGALKRRSYEVKTGDLLILTTDALAKWVFRQVDEKRADPWPRLLEIADATALRQFVEQERSKGELGVDDTTLKIIRL
jgi:hypothetical protein